MLLPLDGPFVTALVDRVTDLVRARLGDHVDAASPYLTVKEAAEYIRAKPQRIYDLLSAGRLTRYKDGARVLVSRDELDAYLAGSGLNQVAPALPPSSQSRINKRVAA